MATYNQYQRQANILSRAINLGFTPNNNETYEETLIQAEQFIIDHVSVEAYERASINWEWQHISWNDRMGYDYECDGEIIDTDFRNRQYFRLPDGNGTRREDIPWYDLPEEGSDDFNELCLDANTIVLDSLARVISLYV